jgi:hypothetical protein
MKIKAIMAGDVITVLEDSMAEEEAQPCSACVRWSRS